MLKTGHPYLSRKFILWLVYVLTKVSNNLCETNEIIYEESFLWSTRLSIACYKSSVVFDIA